MNDLEKSVIDAAVNYFAAKCSLTIEVADRDDPDGADDALHELLDAESGLCDAVRELNKEHAREQEDTYLMGGCTESECRLCHLAPHARKSGMKHSGLTAQQEGGQ